MKVIGVNGSPNREGNTYLIIRAFLDELENEGIETKVIQAGSGEIKSCLGCGGCAESGKCALPDGRFGEWSKDLFGADGMLLAAPAYFGSMPAPMKAFLDRFFFQSIQAGRMRHKVGAAAAVLRRSGGYTTLDDLNRYFFSSEMIIVSSSCPNLVHGRLPGEVLRDAEGMGAIKKLAMNMAWILKMMESTKGKIAPPPYSKKVYTNFIR